MRPARPAVAQTKPAAYEHLKSSFGVKAANAKAAKEQAEKAEKAVKKGQQQLAEGIDLLKK